MSSHPRYLHAIAQKIASDAPDPGDAQRRLERVLDAIEDAQALEGPYHEDASLIVELACTHAPYLASLLVRDRARLARVAKSEYLRRPKPLELMAQELRERTRLIDNSDDLKKCLRVYRADELVRLGVREIRLGVPTEVGRELSSLASVSLDVAIEFHLGELSARYGVPVQEEGANRLGPATLAVIGMGKLGGNELNFSSDIDLIYVYSSDQGHAGELSLHEYFSKLCKSVSASIGDMTEDDAVFRVDLRLRPEGSQGPIANSLISTERYYETFGRPWERQAWIKARPVAGDLKLGRELVSMLKPFVYSKSRSTKIIDEVSALNQQIKIESKDSGIDTGFNVKNGAGAIRDAEFFVQALQLVHGGHNPKLRSRRTLNALDQLLFAGLVSEDERQNLAEGYSFLRRIEHLLQLESGRQTQTLPTKAEDLEVLAKRMKFKTWAHMQQALAEHTLAISKLFATLGEDVEKVSPSILKILSNTMSQLETQDCFRQLGFQNPERATQSLVRARAIRESPFGPSAYGAAKEIAPKFFEAIVSSPDPDRAFAHSIDLMVGQRSWSVIWRLMQSNPAVLQLLASVFGSSEYLSRIVVAHPQQFNALLSSERGTPALTQKQLRTILSRSLHELESDDEERFWNNLAAFKNHQVLRIGLADIGGVLSPGKVSAELSKLAEVCLQTALTWVSHGIETQLGQAIAADGSPCQLAVMALGKLGGRELGYASDLDVIFVYDKEGATEGPRSIETVTYMTRIAQRLMRGLQALHPAGRLYELDTRLRPSGSQGLLVSSLASWKRYHQKRAKIWERQVLTKIRACAGNEALGAEVIGSAKSFVYSIEHSQASKSQLAGEILDMRSRIESESMASSSSLDLKAGPGGIIDIEFAAQFLQLAYGPECESLQVNQTAQVFRAATEEKIISLESASMFIEGYRFLRRLEHRVRIVYDQPSQSLPQDSLELEKLAKRVGYLEGAPLLEAFHQWTRNIREAFFELLR